MARIFGVVPISPKIVAVLACAAAAGYGVALAIGRSLWDATRLMPFYLAGVCAVWILLRLLPRRKPRRPGQ